jgi:hypothetical protein
MKPAFMAHLRRFGGVSLSSRSGRKPRSDWRNGRLPVDRRRAVPLAYKRVREVDAALLANQQAWMYPNAARAHAQHPSSSAVSRRFSTFREGASRRAPGETMSVKRT